MAAICQTFSEWYEYNKSFKPLVTGTRLLLSEKISMNDMNATFDDSYLRVTNKSIDVGYYIYNLYIFV